MSKAVLNWKIMEKNLVGGLGKDGSTLWKETLTKWVCKNRKN